MPRRRLIHKKAYAEEQPKIMHEAVTGVADGWICEWWEYSRVTLSTICLVNGALEHEEHESLNTMRYDWRRRRIMSEKTSNFVTSSNPSMMVAGWDFAWRQYKEQPYILCVHLILMYGRWAEFWLQDKLIHICASSSPQASQARKSTDEQIVGEARIPDHGI